MVSARKVITCSCLLIACFAVMAVQAGNHQGGGSEDFLEALLAAGVLSLIFSDEARYGAGHGYYSADHGHHHLRHRNVVPLVSYRGYDLGGFDGPYAMLNTW